MCILIIMRKYHVFNLAVILIDILFLIISHPFIEYRKQFFFEFPCKVFSDFQNDLTYSIF